VHQEAPAAYPTLRTHRIGIGLYDLVGSALVRRELVEAEFAAARDTAPVFDAAESFWASAGLAASSAAAAIVTDSVMRI